MKKRIIAILLAVAVAAGGEGTLAQAASVSIEMEEYTETAEPTREAISSEWAEPDFEGLEIAEPEEEKEQHGSELGEQGKVQQEPTWRKLQMRQWIQSQRESGKQIQKGGKRQRGT